MPELGVNIDHVATLRQARKTYEPDPVAAAVLCELGGADAITSTSARTAGTSRTATCGCSARRCTIKLNLELSVADEIVGIACQVKPEQATIVPERREEVTTEGGLDVVAHREATAPGDRAAAGGGNFGQPVPRSRSAADRAGQAARRRRRRAAHRPVRTGPRTSPARAARRPDERRQAGPRPGPALARGPRPELSQRRARGPDCRRCAS